MVWCGVVCCCVSVRENVSRERESHMKIVIGRFCQRMCVSGNIFCLMSICDTVYC